MIDQKQIQLPTFTRGFHLITDEVMSQLKLPNTGLMNIFILHTSAGLTINENADPTVRKDLEASFNHIVKENEPFYEHTFEGSDDMPAHIKSSLVGTHVSVPIQNHQLLLGTWQGIYLCEFRNNGGSRKLTATIYS